MKRILKVLMSIIFIGFLPFCLIVGLVRTAFDFGSDGNLGEHCFPNHTCNSPNTCFQISEDEMCYKEIKPVVPYNTDFCFTLSEDGLQTEGDTRCFNTFDECIQQFGLILQKTTKPVVKGCSWE